MRPRNDIDAVDLVQAQPADQAPELRAADRRTGRRDAEALSGESDTSRLGERNAVGQRRAIRLAAQA